jgi:hypothetical protein
MEKKVCGGKMFLRNRFLTKKSYEPVGAFLSNLLTARRAFHLPRALFIYRFVLERDSTSLLTSSALPPSSATLQ